MRRGNLRGILQKRRKVERFISWILNIDGEKVGGKGVSAGGYL